jgi:transcriptional regulator with XRE-family HTH domain
MLMARNKRPESVRDLQIQIGERIRWVRELVAPNAAAFAREMELHHSTLQYIENGSRAPSIFHVMQIADKLRVTTDYILFGTLRGVDGELAATLATRHPELMSGKDVV